MHVISRIIILQTKLMIYQFLYERMSESKVPNFIATK